MKTRAALGRLAGGLAAALALAAGAGAQDEPPTPEAQLAAGRALLPPLGIALAGQSSWGLLEWIEIPLDGPLAQGLKVPEGRGLSVWTRGLELDISGTEGGVRYSGKGRHAFLGMDMLMENQVAGVALTSVESDIDFMGSGFAEGVHEISLTGIHPYGGGILDDGSQAWVALSYEMGELEVRAADASEARDLSLLTLVAGAKGPYIWEKQTGAGITRIISIADGFYSRISEEGDTERDFDAWRARFGVELSHDYATAGGTALGLAWNLAYRYDGGDFADGRGFELGLGLNLSLAFGLRLEVAARTLTSGDEELDDMALVAGLSWSQAYRNQSQSFSLNFTPAGGGLGLAGDFRPPGPGGHPAGQGLRSPAPGGSLGLAGDFRPPGPGGHPASQGLQAPGQLLEFRYERRF